MTPHLRHALVLAVFLVTGSAHAQTLRVSFDQSPVADRAAGRAEPWVARGVEWVAGRFGQAAQIAPAGQIIYAGEQNILAGRGTLACWCRIPERPGPRDVQRLLFVQAKERGYWNYLATLEWQESAFRAMVFDFFHGHGWHDAAALPAFTPGQWHHIALVWDQARGVQFFLDGQPAGSDLDAQPWWDRPTPHAIHLGWPGAAYDELCVYDRALTVAEIAELAARNRWDLPHPPTAWADEDRDRLRRSLNAVALEALPELTALPASHAPPGPRTTIRLARVKQVLDDKIPAWRVLDGRMNLFWPEWRGPVLGDVDYGGSELLVGYEPGQRLTHMVLRGLLGGCRMYGERDGFVARQPLLEVPEGLHFLAATRLPRDLTGLYVPRRAGMKLHEITALAVESPGAEPAAPAPIRTPLTGTLDLAALNQQAADLRTRTLPEERLVIGKAAAASPTRHAVPALSSHSGLIGPPAWAASPTRHAVPALSRVHFISDPVEQAIPLAAVELRVTFNAAWDESVWTLRVQDPVNPRRDLLQVPVRVVNAAPGQDVVLDVVLDFWDIMLDAGGRLWVELQPWHAVQWATGPAGGAVLSLHAGDRAAVLDEFAHTQSQLAYSYWQLGSEADGSRGADPAAPGFALLGHVTHNRELKLTMEWVRRYVPDQPLVRRLWRVIYESQTTAPVTPRLQPPGAPDWAVWGRELLERFRTMSHHWADRQSPDGQLGGGWNDDTDFPGVFISLPLLGDTRTRDMFARVFDGIERTGYLQHGIARGPIDALHATDFLSWRAHLMLFDYGEPRHLERALSLTRALQQWTHVDAWGHRRFVANHYSEDGPGVQPRTEVGDSGLVEPTGAERADSAVNRNWLRDPLFCAWYSRNPTVLQFIREVAEGDLARVQAGGTIGTYDAYPFYSYFTLFGDPKYFEGPVDRFLRDRWNLPIWRRYAQRLPNGNRLDADLIRGAAAKHASDEQLTAAFVASRDPSYLARALREACERLEGGWQFRGGEAGGANDHFYVTGQAALSQLYLGGSLTWLRPASILPPIAVSWEGIDADVAALVVECDSQRLRVAAFNFVDRPRTVRMRVWELVPGAYQVREGPDVDGDHQFDGPATSHEHRIVRGTAVELRLPPRQQRLIELHQLKAQPRPAGLADLAVGDGDVYYDKATDRLKVVVHNIGAAAAEPFTVRFEDAAGRLLADRPMSRIDAPLDLVPKTATAWLPQPTLHPTTHIVVRVDHHGQVPEITEENNLAVWTP